MTYTRETMQKMRREELKNIAISYRIYNGYHERPISKMRKSDFMILFMNQLQHQITLLIPEKLFYKNANRQDRRRRREIDITKMLLYILYPLLFHLETLYRILMQEDE